MGQYKDTVFRNSDKEPYLPIVLLIFTKQLKGQRHFCMRSAQVYPCEDPPVKFVMLTLFLS